RDIHLRVAPGEVLGIIGRNGAGKSTLLKILSRITEPSSGTAEVRGRIGSLLEVGTGFHSELTGRENIYLNGAILGMKKAEINRKFDEIVAFADVDQFLDTQVKRYSSGMYVRLAFAVAAHLEPEILMVDEVLAVGDSAFQKKCMGKMNDVAESGRTVLFVSHQLNQIRRLCNRVVCLEGGRIQFSGPPVDAIEFYENSLLTPSLADKKKEGGFLFWETTAGGHVIKDTSTPVTIQILFDGKEPINNGHLGVVLYNDQDFLVAGWALENVQMHSGRQAIFLTLPHLPLQPGIYSFQFGLFNNGNNLTGGRLLDLWHATPKLTMDVPLHSHPQERWAGVLNIAPKFHIDGDHLDCLS
ncbi:MAG: ABC transporter protein, partial [Magnetococcales bacterium]|nr:ABC transporter protein [Magnetococcales bacterium]